MANYEYSDTISNPDELPNSYFYNSKAPGKDFKLRPENGDYTAKVTVKNGSVAKWEETNYYLAWFNKELQDEQSGDTFHFNNMKLTLEGDFNHDHVWHDETKGQDRALLVTGFGNRYSEYLTDSVTFNIDTLDVNIDVALKGWHINTYGLTNAIEDCAKCTPSGATVNIGDTKIQTKVRIDQSTPKTRVGNSGVYVSGDKTVVNFNGNTYINILPVEGLQEVYIDGIKGGMDAPTKSEGQVLNYAIVARDKGIVTVNMAGGKKVELLGNANVLNGTLTINLDDPLSYWHGRATQLSDDSNLTLKISNGAHWVPILPREAMQNLEMKEGGFVDLHGLNEHTQKAGVTQQLYVNHLTGEGGTFIMDLTSANKSGPLADPTYDIDTQDSTPVDGHNDFLFVKEGSGSVSVLPVDSNKLADVTRETPIWFADVPNDITFTAFAEKSSLSDGFVYDYTPIVDKNVVDSDTSKNKNGTNWYIVGVDKTPTTTTETTIADTALNYAAATAFLELDSLNKRLGEIRHYGDSKAGLWVRAKAGRITSDTNGYFRSNYQFYQLGSDYVYKPTNGEGTFLFGGAIHTANHDAKYDQGSGDTDTVGGSLYLSWFNPQGFYADLIGRYTHLKDDYSIDARGESVKASYSNDAWSLSAEGGKRFDIGQSFSIEPEAQLVYTHVTGIDYTLSNGMRIDQDSANSLIGRLGVRLGSDFRFSEELAPSKVYFKADVYREFAGDRDVRLTGQDATLTRDVDGGDTWFTYGIGADFSVTKNLFIYADVQKSAGGDVDTKWEVNGGLRWAF